MARYELGRTQWEQIGTRVRNEYGPGWAHLSETQKTNAIHSAILMAVLCQSASIEVFEPAKELIRSGLDYFKGE